MKSRKIIFGMITVALITGCTISGLPVDQKPDFEIEKISSPAIISSETKPLEIKYSVSQEDTGSGEDTSEDVPETTKVEGTLPNGGINPLTGLPVKNPENLNLPPALVSVTNFPPTARPQAGLSTSPIVFELFIGDGMTRFLAIFYGDYPQTSEQLNPGELREDLSKGMQEPVIGPVRSGRLPYEHVRQLFNGFIVMASAYSKVADQLTDYVNVFGDDASDVNSAMVSVDDIEQIAKDSGKELGEAALSGMVFDEKAPADGKDAHSLWIYYAYKNQVFWRYNEGDGSYHRWQDDADGSTFIEMTDRLNGEPLTYENVIILYADHIVQNTYMIDVDLMYVKRGKAVLFRDGKMQDIYWTTRSEEYEQTTGKLRPIRFVDVDGNPIALKPGQTWIELMPNYTPFWETVDSETYHILVNGRSKGSGFWGLYFKLDY